MRGRVHLRLVAVVLAFVVSATCGALSLMGPASAVANTVTCHSLTANNSSSLYLLGGCSGRTGGSGSVSQSTMTITWKNGLTTILATRPFAPTPISKRGRCAAGSTRYAIDDHVTEDFTGSIKPGGKVTAQVCIGDTVPGTWSLVPRTVFTLA